MQEQGLAIEGVGPRYTHSSFRYPAKFHPPVVRALLSRYAPRGSLVLDNFCGSGTLLVEAAVDKRHSIGIDVDPLAVWVSRAKTRCYDVNLVGRDAARLIRSVDALEGACAAYRSSAGDDMPTAYLQRAVSEEGLWIPDIPNIEHWFRRSVLLDLARIDRLMQDPELDESSRQLFRLAFAASIRNVSNADPVPVSGLEVTSHMRAKEAAGRVINTPSVFRRRLEKVISAASEYSGVVQHEYEPRVVLADATALPGGLPAADVVITSPPYHNAVDYYRRHTLEMYWLRLVESHADRLRLLPRYIGRPRVAAKSPMLVQEWNPGRLAESWYERMLQVSTQRATDFRHYITSMQLVFRELRPVVKDGGHIAMVVGDSSWESERIPTVDLLAEVAAPTFALTERLSYPIKNRYMSYSRRNGASIAVEHVAVFR